MSNLSCGTHVAEPTANIDCRKLLNQSCRFLPKLKLPISADAKLPLTFGEHNTLKAQHFPTQRYSFFHYYNIYFFGRYLFKEKSICPILADALID